MLQAGLPLAMNELLNARRPGRSVADTLEQARLALKTHRAWMQTRSTIAPSPDRGPETQPPQPGPDSGPATQPPLHLFTSKESERSKIESVILPKEDTLSPAPPPISAKKRDSKVAPADSLFLPQQGAPTVGVPLQFYGTKNTEQAFATAQEKPSRKESLEGSNKELSSLPRKRGGGVSKIRIAPLSRDDDEIGSPTSPAGVFYGNLPGKITPTPNGWTDKSPQLDHTEDEMTASSGGPPGLASNDNESELNLSDSNDMDLSILHAQTLQEEGGAPILPVSPAPRDQRSSYSSHTQFKMRTVEESLEILSSKSERRMLSGATEPTSFRLPLNKTDVTKNDIQSEKMEDAYMQRVLPNKPHQEASKMASPASLSEGLEDIETIDVFSIDSTVTEAPATTTHNISRKVEENSSSTSPKLTNENEDVVTHDIKPATIDPKESLAPRHDDITVPDSPSPTVSVKSANSVKSVNSEESAKSEEGVKSVGPKGLKLPPLITRETGPVDGSTLVKQLPLLKSPLTPYTTGFVFSCKRLRDPPPYTVHRPPGSMGLAPPCPLYGVSQPKDIKGPLQSLPSDPSPREHPEQNTSPSEPVTPAPSITYTPSLFTHPSGPGALHLAARSGNLRRLLALINKGYDVDLPDHNGQTPLMYCIHQTGVHLSCADALIKEGANVNKQSSDGSTAMHLASAVGGVALVELMILNGARTDVRDFEGRLPLHWATTQKSTKIISVLLEHCVGIDVTDDVGMTPLMWASYNNSPSAVAFLLGRGADREEKDNDGYTAMHWAVHREGTQCLTLLLQPDMTYFKDHKGKTVVLFASEKGAMLACELILKMRTDAIYDTDKMDRTPLHYAAACGHVDVCALLLDRGADATQRDSTGRTPLDYARVKSLDYVVALLTCHGTAVADFARASRSTSVESLLNRTVSFGQLSRVSGASLVSQPGTLSKSLASMTSSQTTRSEHPSVATPTSATPPFGEGGVDVEKGGYLGRFVSDKTDPLRHFFFRLSSFQGTLSWRQEKGGAEEGVATVLEVHNGPSSTLRQSSLYSPAELHRHVFWVLTSGGVLDLLAYNDTDHTIWLQAMQQVALDNDTRGDVGQALRRQQRIKGSGLASPSTQPRQKVGPSLNDQNPSSDMSQLNTSNTSKLFIGGVSSTTTPRPSSPMALDGHMTDHMTSNGFETSDIFVTSTPRANDAI